MLPHSRGGAGRPLVALHGNFASRAWWQDLVSAPPAGWEVVAPDLPGFAGTEPCTPLSIPGYADAVDAFMRSLGLDRPVLIGHSFGGAVALELAARAPAAYAGLVLCASAPVSGFKTPEENYPVLELMRTNPALVEMSFGAQFPSRRPTYFAQLVAEATCMHASLYSGNARALECWNVTDRVPKLPVLVLGGTLDTLVTPDMTAGLARALGVRPTMLEGRGHGFPQENPEEFLQQLQGFLGALPSTMTPSVC